MVAALALALLSQQEPEDLTELTLEELMKLEITTVSKKEESLQSAASAITVLRHEDLRRAGVRSVAEALRMVPGVQVARLDGNKWAISARGFNGRFANKLLVLVDGRSAYTPLFSGTYWDALNVMIEDIERIEVIRGPGGSLWGANAVNGVINILTKPAKETQGLLAVAGGGSEERGFGSIRYGGSVDQELYWRVYAEYFNRDEQHDGNDDWWMAHAGWRADWLPAAGTTITFQGDWYDGAEHDRLLVPLLTPPFSRFFGARTEVSGGTLLARWEQTFDAESQLALQFYFDRTERETEIHHEVRDTFDLDFQHRFRPFDKLDLVWGLGYRNTRDELDPSFTLAWDPDDRRDELLSAFLQGELLFSDAVRATLGAKFEYNEYSRFEFQPTARLSATPHPRHTFWTSISRAVRTPSRSESDVRINREARPPPGPMIPPLLVAIFGDDDFGAENLIAFEAGYRLRPWDILSVDFAFFHNEYEDLRTLEPAGRFVEFSPLPPHLVLPFRADNRMEGRVTGFEVSFNLRPVEWWMVQANYAYLRTRLELEGDSFDTTSKAAEGESPRHQIYVRSSFNLPLDIQLDVVYRFVDDLPELDVSDYSELDFRLGWKAGKECEVAIVGQNLLHSRHLEFRPAFVDTEPTEIERSIYAMVTVRF